MGAEVAEVRGAEDVRVAVEVEVAAEGLETVKFNDDPVERLDFCFEDEEDDAGFE